MTVDEKLAAILAAVQTDLGGRGLAKDPHDNLFTATAGDFEKACRGIATQPEPRVFIHTGFLITSLDPPEFETDGPLGAMHLYHAIRSCGGKADVLGDEPITRCVYAAHETLREYPLDMDSWSPITRIYLECVGPSADGKCYTMRGKETPPVKPLPGTPGLTGRTTIGIGDGGNEIGMGKIPHETIVKNIPNGDLIHCRVPTDHLIVAGVSNWGAYALAAGIFVLRGVKPPPDLFDPDREREILEVMVREGPLVDGVTGKQTATVDGLTWEEYSQPLIRMAEILND